MNDRSRRGVVSGLALLFFLAPLKFTNPVILNFPGFLPERWWNILGTWPNGCFHLLLLPLALVGLGCGKWSREEIRMAILPVAFLLIQLLSASTSLAPDLSRLVLPFFFSLVAGYLLGVRTIRTETDLRWLGFAWILGSLIVVSYGIIQGTGGLEETREYLRENPQFAANLPELWKKVESDRIYSTFINPNALGGYLAASVFVVAAWSVIAWKNSVPGFFKSGKGRDNLDLGKIILLVFSLILILLFFTCLWLTQSKGSYAALFLSLIAGVLLLTSRPKTAAILVAALCMVAVLGFAVGYGKKAVTKGKITWEQRTAYWRAAWKIGRDHPIWGTGPGSFSRFYPQYKRAQDESTRLAHNNYLQMWSDSGLLGFIAFAAWLPGSLVLWVWRWKKAPFKERLAPALWWCGCLTFALHSLVDFDLYLISNSWSIFVVLGHLAISKPSTQI